MAIYRSTDAYDVRLDKRTVTITAHGTCRTSVMGRWARAENDDQPVTFDATWTNGDGSVSRRYFREGPTDNDDETYARAARREADLDAAD